MPSSSPLRATAGESSTLPAGRPRPRTTPRGPRPRGPTPPGPTPPGRAGASWADASWSDLSFASASWADTSTAAASWADLSLASASWADNAGDETAQPDAGAIDPAELAAILAGTLDPVTSCSLPGVTRSGESIEGSPNGDAPSPGGSTFRGGLSTAAHPFDAWRRSTCDEGPHEGMNGRPPISRSSPSPARGETGRCPETRRSTSSRSRSSAAAVTLPFIGRLQTTAPVAGLPHPRLGSRDARLFVVRTPADQAYHTDIVFLIPAALILPPELLVLVAVVQMVPEWLKMRYRWYLQTFNILDYSLSAMAAWFVGRVADPRTRGDRERCTAALAGRACGLRRLRRGQPHPARSDAGARARLHAARDRPLRRRVSSPPISCSQRWASRSTPSGSRIPWLVPFALTPLFLIHRSLSVPALQAEARVDPKTGLFNARHFAAALAEEIGRARRFERPMSLIMADLDLLRDINNTYGHLAGDAVLKGIAEVFRAQLRHYDVPARFGGEEFSILLPETPPDQALEIAERIRRAVAERTVRRRDLERSHSRHRLDRRRRLPEGRHRCERADPPGGPRRLPREASGTKPCARCELRAAAHSGRPFDAIDRSAGGRRPSRASSRRAPQVQPTEERRESAPSTSTRGPWPAVPLARPAAEPDRRARQHCGRRGRHRRPCVHLDHEGPARPADGRRPRRSGAGARARGGRRIRRALGQRGRLSRGCVALRLPRRAATRARERGGRVERASCAAAQRALQRRRADARIAGCGERLQDCGLLPGRHRTPARRLGPRPARGRGVLRRQHGPRLAGARPAGTRALVVGLQGALCVAAAALPRLRLHRRRHGARVRGRPATRPRGVRRAVAPDAQDTGGVPQAHPAQRRRSFARRPRRSSRRTCRSSLRTSC